MFTSCNLLRLCYALKGCNSDKYWVKHKSDLTALKKDDLCQREIYVDLAFLSLFFCKVQNTGVICVTGRKTSCLLELRCS